MLSPADLERIYGLMVVVCPHCDRAMYFDEVDFDDEVRCDRCKRPVWRV